MGRNMTMPGFEQQRAAEARIVTLESALRLIAAYKGQTLYNHDVGYREGASEAFDQCAHIAEQALQK
jgi:hypothetical protein